MKSATSQRSSSVNELLEDNASKLRHGIARVDRGVRRFSLREPVVAVLGALFLGYVVGRVATKL